MSGRLHHALVAFVAIAALVLIALAHRFSPEQPSHFLDKIVHSLHAPGFAGVTFFVFAILRLYHRGSRNYLYAGAIAMGIGVLSEAAQIPGPRDAEFSDLVTDGIGIFGALGLLVLFDRDIKQRIAVITRRRIGYATLLALLVSFGPTALYTYALIAQKNALPVLLSFEQRWERLIYSMPGSNRMDRIDAPATWPVKGKVVRVTSSRRGGLLEWRPYPDWSQSDNFSFVAATGDGKVWEVLVYIEDSRPNGVKESNYLRSIVEIGPNPTRIRIPFTTLRAESDTRPFEIAHVKRVFLRLNERTGGIPVILDDFRLEPQDPAIGG
ncbi:MAG: hypothetical protein OEV58_09165 [Gammaproteobacteria bacterium]|nr:hypothetical protein [Gammaproteobacteria bacterium]MDH5262594.1 hypothetical protein [Gammaproteobacteria bacterium]